MYLETLEREAVLGAAYKAGRNLVVLAGDTYNGWASNLRDASGSQVGVEFATPSVSSGGLETYLKLEPEQAEEFARDLEVYWLMILSTLTQRTAAI